jgi:hypothetical protein
MLIQKIIINVYHTNVPTSQYANESWYSEHCRLWQIQSTAKAKLEQKINLLSSQ